MEIKIENVSQTGWTAAHGEASKHLMERWNGTGKLDSKGREIGFILGTNQNFNGKEFAAWVQSARKNVATGEVENFGVPQRAKYYTSKEEAKRWAVRTVAERIAKVK